MEQHEKSKLMRETFFIIDSNNADQVSSHLYGYYADRKNAFVNSELPDGFRADQKAIGAFVAVVREGNEIKIYQDSSNQFYLLQYSDGDYFCISNNFYMMCEHLTAEKHPLTLNKPYAHQLISTSMSPVSLINTLAKEISVIPMFCDVTIELKTRSLLIHENEVHLGSVDVDSEEGMELLDDWISRWASFINAALCKHKFCGRIDLSGGYDSRTVFSIAYAGGIDLNAPNIFVYSLSPVSKGQIAHHKGDLETAQRIADLLGFQLNQHENIGDKMRISGKYAYEVFKNSFEGFHRQAYLENHVYREPYFHLGGFGGEPVRGTYQGRKKWFWLIDHNPICHKPEVYDELLNDLDYLTERSTDDYEMFRKLFLYGWSRNHFGMTAVRDLLLGRFVISPYFDLDIYNLKFPEGISKDAIFALTIQRTCPELLTIPYSDGTDFSEKTKEYVRYLCEKYESKIKLFGDNLNLSVFSGLDVLPNDNNNMKQSGPEYLYEIFRTDRNRSLFLNTFGPYGEKIYDYADAAYHDKERFAYTEFCGAIAAIMEFQRIVEDPYVDEQVARLRGTGNNYPEIENVHAILREWDAYKTGRIDLKILDSQENDIVIDSISDSSAVVTSMEGIGTVIESTSGKLNVSFICKGDGKLQINLRGIDFRDAEHKRVPVWIRFRILKINGVSAFSTVKNVCYDENFTITKSVEYGEKVELSFEFEPGGKIPDDKNLNDKNDLLIGKQNKQSRNISIDVMNILYCIAVIALHHNGLVHSYDTTRAWKESLVIECVMYWCVPVFLMITGATLMDYRKRYNTKTFFKKRFYRGVIPWLAWSLIFLVWMVSTNQITLSSPLQFKQILDLVLNNKIMTVYWFYSTLFAVYLALPVFSLITDHRRALWYAVGINFFFTALLPVIRTWTKLSWSLDIPIVGSCFIFVLLGYLLKEKKFSPKQRILIYIVGFGNMVFRFVYTWHYSVINGYTDTSIKGFQLFHSVFYAVAIWIMANHIDWEKLIPGWLKSKLPTISSCSLGIYLIHRFIMYYEQNLLHIDHHSLIWRTGFIFITYFICLGLVYLMKKIPVFNKIVP